MVDFISARIKPMEIDYPRDLRDLRTNLFKQGEYDGNPSIPFVLKESYQLGNLIMLVKG